jgi:hypothetical protein
MSRRSRDKAPERDEQLACQRDYHRLARARTAIGSAGPVPQCQCALLLKAGGGAWRDEYLRRAVQNCRRAVRGETPWNLIGPDERML